MLRKEFAKIDEREAIKSCRTFCREFVYIHSYSYHEQVSRDILYIDATGTVIDKIKGYGRLLCYVAAIRHPFGKSPPLPIAEYITTMHDQFSIRQFLMAIHEKEYRKKRHHYQPPSCVNRF